MPRRSSRTSKSKLNLTVRDVPSKGLSSRISGVEPSEVLNLLSGLERHYCYSVLWSNSVQKVETQRILPLEETLKIAERIGVKHPQDQISKEWYPMSTDFIIDLRGDGDVRKIARSVKPANQLNSVRTMGKLEIERLYWKEIDIDWGIVTEQQISINFAKNAEYFLSCLEKSEHAPIPQSLLFQVESELFQEIQTSANSLSMSALNIDKRLGFQPGTCLWFVRHLVATKNWVVDMEVLFEPSNKIEIQRSSTMLNKVGEQAQ